jgi:hypothetical protein
VSPHRTNPDDARRAFEAPAGEEAREPAKAGQARSGAAGGSRKGWEEDEEFAKDCEASVTEVPLVKFPPDLQMRISLALGRIEDDACWATARKHPKFSRLFALASIGSMCLEHAAGALEYLNAGPLTGKGKRKFDRAVGKAERLAQEIEQSGELKALLAKRRANLDKATLAREEDAQALAERVAELDRENPAYSHVEMAKKLAAEGIHHKKNRKPYTARRIGQIRNKQ